MDVTPQRDAKRRISACYCAPSRSHPVTGPLLHAPAHPLPEGEGSVERNRTVARFRMFSNDPQPIRFYRPDYHVRTPEMCSPEYVQMSTAAAITLGLVPGKMHRTSCTHCLNLLITYPEGCRANCACCGLAQHREETRDHADRNFIRVDWPAVHYEEIIARVENGDDRKQFERMCISMISHPDFSDDTFVLLERWVREVPHIPVSILSNPTTLDYADLARMRDLGRISSRWRW